jgi:hypothetical protein
MAGHRSPVPPPGRAGPDARPAGVDPAGMRPASGHRSRAVPTAVAACVVGYAAVAGGYPSFSLGAAVAVLLPGLALLGYVLVAGPRRPPRPVRRSTRRGAVLWAVPVLSFSALEIVNDTLGSTHEHPTLSVLADPLLASHPGRSVAMAAWLAAGLAVVRL